MIRVALTPDGRKIARRTLGVARGNVVPLDRDGEDPAVLTIAEGVETGITARMFGLGATLGRRGKLTDRLSGRSPYRRGGGRHRERALAGRGLVMVRTTAGLARPSRLPVLRQEPRHGSGFWADPHSEDQFAAGFDRVSADYELKKQTAEALRDVWKAEVRDAVKAGGAGPDMPAGAEDPEPPVRPRIRIADVTTEKAGALAAALPRGLLMARDELAGWVASFDRYGGSGSDRAFFLEAYGGRSYRIDRMKTPEPITIRHLSIGVLGTTQPDRLAAITGGADDGLASRVLWSWPEATPSFTLARDPIDDGDAKFAFSRLQFLQMSTDEYGNPGPVRLRLDLEAEDEIEAFARDMLTLGEHATGVYAGALGKARGHVLRLATVLEFLWWRGSGNRPEPLTISAKAIVAAAGLVGGYFMPMAERVHGDATVPPAERGAAKLVRYLRREKLATFNARTLCKTVGGELRAAEAMDSACGALMDASLIREVASERKGPVRKPKNYAVHPAVYRSA